MLLWSSADFFKNNFFKNKTNNNNNIGNTIRVSNSLDPDQNRHPVGPDLDPNCLQRLSTDNTRKELIKHDAYDSGDGRVHLKTDLFLNKQLHVCPLNIWINPLYKIGSP